LPLPGLSAPIGQCFRRASAIACLGGIADHIEHVAQAERSWRFCRRVPNSILCVFWPGARIVKVLIFGATGMVGRGVLRECLIADDVTLAQTVGRTATGETHPKLRELLHADLFDYAPTEERLRDFDACFFCLGVSSGGMPEAQYTRLTHDLTLAAATVLARLNPSMTFTYVSGAGTDSSEQGRSMWARVKGRTENGLLRLPFKAVYLFRPGAIQPLDGIVSKTTSYRIGYTLAKPFLSLLRKMLPRQILTTRSVGVAMLEVVRHGADKAVLETADIYRIAQGAGS
jgi:uncharacterized protein YbjT (DUF2867 family)